MLNRLNPHSLVSRCIVCYNLQKSCIWAKLRRTVFYTKRSGCKLRMNSNLPSYVRTCSKLLTPTTLAFTIYNNSGIAQETNLHKSTEEDPTGGVDVSENVDDLAVDIEKVNEKSTEALIELLHTLNFCIIEISQQYRSCMKRQIQFTVDGTDSDEDWDNLIQSRVQSEELKQEFEKFKAMIKRIEQFVFNHAVRNLLAGNENIMDILNKEFNTLMIYLQNLETENNELEQQLLVAKRNAILSEMQT